jgi:transcription elongation factor GreA
MQPVPLTQEGMDRLKEELGHLKSVERPAIIQAIAVARAHGDLRENAEYHAAREKQGFIEARIADLEDKLSRAQVVVFAGNTKDVRFGAWVTLSSEEGDKKTYRIVGELESDIKVNRISISSPIARALLGKSAGDLVEMQAPGGAREYEILKVAYTPS